MKRSRSTRPSPGFRQRTGVPIVVFIPASLAGNNIEDVAYQTFNTWKLGDKDKDNGVLIVIAVDERRARIEVGDGLGGVLTDLQAERHHPAQDGAAARDRAVAARDRCWLHRDRAGDRERSGQCASTRPRKVGRRVRGHLG